MIIFPNCKINLGLQITSKRTDGYHDLQTVFYPVGLKDALEILEADETTLTTTGLPIPGNVDDNLCLKAWHVLKADFPHLPPVKIHLHKAIPLGAGLGGGSADGACMLLLLNNKFELKLTQSQLIAYALQLGSDCPFFIINKPVFAEGRGEIMTPVEVDLSGYYFVIVNPGIHISTKEAFSAIIPQIPSKDIKDILHQPVATWKKELFNQFEAQLFLSYPGIAGLKDDLYQAGALYAAMTGTGSTVYGIFDKKTVFNLTFPKHYLVLQIPA